MADSRPSISAAFGKYSEAPDLGSLVNYNLHDFKVQEGLGFRVETINIWASIISNTILEAPLCTYVTTNKPFRVLEGEYQENSKRPRGDHGDHDTRRPPRDQQGAARRTAGDHQATTTTPGEHQKNDHDDNDHESTRRPPRDYQEMARRPSGDHQDTPSRDRPETIKKLPATSTATRTTNHTPDVVCQVLAGFRRIWEHGREGFPKYWALKHWRVPEHDTHVACNISGSPVRAATQIRCK